MLPECIANLLVGYDIHRCSRDNSVMEFREKRDSESESEERAPTHAPTWNVGAVPRVLMLLRLQGSACALSLWSCTRASGGASVYRNAISLRVGILLVRLLCPLLD
jgi:hypothetical protein